MKSKKLMIGCAAVVAFTACSHLGQRELASSTPRAAHINAAMDSAMIAQIDLQRVPAEAALRAWFDASRVAHPQPVTVKYILVHPTTFTQRSATQAKPPKKTPMVTVRKRNVTSKWLLNEICRQADWVWTVRGGEVAIGPREAFPNPQP